MLAVPLLPIGVAHETGEVLLEFQTVRSLSNTTSRGSDYMTLPVDLQGSMTSIKNSETKSCETYRRLKPQRGEATTALARLDGASGKGAPR